jgi:hypothetical protein
MASDADFFNHCHSRLGSLRQAGTLLDRALKDKDVGGDLLLASLLESYAECVAHSVVVLPDEDLEDMDEVDGYDDCDLLVICHKLCLLLYERYKECRKSTLCVVSCAANIWFALFYIANYVLENARTLPGLELSYQIVWTQTVFKELLPEIIRYVDDTLKAAEADSSDPVVTVLPHVCQVLQQVAEFARMGFTPERHQEIMRTVTLPIFEQVVNAEDIFADPIQQWHTSFPNTIISPMLLKNTHSHYASDPAFNSSHRSSSSLSSPLSGRYSAREHWELRIYATMLMLQHGCLVMFDSKYTVHVLDGTVGGLVQVACKSFEYAHCKKEVPLADGEPFWECLCADKGSLAKAIEKVIDSWPVHEAFQMFPPTVLWERAAGFALCALTQLVGSSGSNKNKGELNKTFNCWKSSVQLQWHMNLVFLQCGELSRSFSKLILFCVSRQKHVVQEHLVTYTLRQLHCKEVGSIPAALQLQRATAHLWSAWEVLKSDQRDEEKCSALVAAAKEEALHVVCPCPQCSSH